MGPYLISWNIRGVGTTIKKRETRRLVNSHNLDLLLLQETKVKEEARGLYEAIWGRTSARGVLVESIGNSGGLITVWDEEVIHATVIHKSKNLLVIKAKWNVSNRTNMIANVYGPTLVSKKKTLWQELVNQIRQSDDPWVIGGDFNAVRNDEERKGKQECRLEMEDFNSFIDEAELIDFPIHGKIFTWFGPGGKRSRLDRFLATQNWVLEFSNICQRSLTRNVSDHTPVLLTCDEEN